MQVKVSSKVMESILENAECRISQRSEKQVIALKRMNYGAIHIRFKRKILPYPLEEWSYWLADIHFERDLRPQHAFEPQEVKDFVKEYVEPFSSSRNP